MLAMKTISGDRTTLCQTGSAFHSPLSILTLVESFKPFQPQPRHSSLAPHILNTRLGARQASNE